MNQICLDGSWTLYYHPEEGALPKNPAELKIADWPHIPAEVPGNVELDLFRAGVEGDPFWDENLYAFRKYEFYQWWLTREFEAPAEMRGHRCVLRFGGIDTFAEVFVNHVLVGQSENMLIEQEFDVTEALKFGAVNTVSVRIRSCINEVRKMDYPVAARGGEGSDEYTQIRKAPSMFGWDIMPRLVSAGLWRGVTLEALPASRLTQVYLTTTRVKDGGASIMCSYRFDTDETYLDDFRVRIEGVCGESRFEAENAVLFVSGSTFIDVPDAKLWWPRHYGEQALYDVKVTLIHKGVAVDEYTARFGIRQLVVDTKWAPGDEGEFRILCNGCPILAKGSNWVPMDAMHSRDAQRVKAALDLFYDAGCNIVRCWGGNVYEDHNFFDLCDEYGIMVWQDFAMASAIYSPDERMVRLLEEEATSVVRKLRNHACILLWAGDNEVDEAYVWTGSYLPGSNRYNALTREVLPRVIRMNDPNRLFLPSSPYIPDGIAHYGGPEQHNWGARAYFKDDFYKHSSAHFISECGYHGCPAPSSLKKFIPENKLTPWLHNSSWDAHNTDYLPRGERGYNRIQLMDDQVRIFFGAVPEDLDTFALLSQVVQAEAKKFFIERTRIKKWRRTGIIWWNMIDGWPQISDAVVDYYYTKKLAYHYIRRVQRPICLMMDELVDWSHEVVLGNDSREGREVSYRVVDAESGAVLLSGRKYSPANENVSLGHIREMASDQKLYLLYYTVDGVEYANHFISGYPHFDAGKMMKWIEIIKNLPEAFELTM